MRNLFLHFFFLYKNDILLQSMSESEFSSYIWTPSLRNAFLGRDDLKLSCGELASKSYEKLKEILNVSSRSAPKLDGKEFLKSLGTEILARGWCFKHPQQKDRDLQNWNIILKLSLQPCFLRYQSQHHSITTSQILKHTPFI